jgi:hypothetical protein
LNRTDTDVHLVPAAQSSADRRVDFNARRLLDRLPTPLGISPSYRDVPDENILLNNNQREQDTKPAERQQNFAMVANRQQAGFIRENPRILAAAQEVVDHARRHCVVAARRAG